MTDVETKIVRDTLVVRGVGLENITWRDRYSYGDYQLVGTLGELAEAIDREAEDAIDRRGGSGIGAGAYLELLDPDDVADALAKLRQTQPDADESDLDDEALDECGSEAITSVFHPMTEGMKIGEARDVRKFIRSQRNVACWDGNNHVPAPTPASHELLEWMNATGATATSRIRHNRRD